HANHDGNFLSHGGGGFDHALRDDIAAENSTKDVDQHCLHGFVRKQDAKRVADLFDIGSSAGIQKIRRTAARELHDIHGRHRESSAVHQAGDVAVELDVGQAETRGFHFQGVFLVQIAQLL